MAWKTISTSIGTSTSIPNCGTVASSTSSKPEPQCRPSRPSGRTSSIGAGREAAGASSSSSGVIAKYCAPAASGGGEGHSPERGRVVLLEPPPPALAFSERCALWCVLSARAIATLIRAYRRYARRRRSLRRRALPVPPPPPSRSTSIVNRWSFTKGYAKWQLLSGNACLVCLVCLVLTHSSGTVSLSTKLRDEIGTGPRAAHSKNCVPSRAEKWTRRPRGRSPKNDAFHVEKRGEKRGRHPRLNHHRQVRGAHKNNVQVSIKCDGARA